MKLSEMNVRVRLALSRLFLPRGTRVAAGDIPRPSADSEDEIGSGELMISRARKVMDWIKQSQQDRLEQYELYDELDEYPEISSVLDAYAEEATQLDPERGQAIWIESKDEGIEALGRSFLEIVQSEENAEAWVRDLAKYGDFYHRVYGDSGTGVESVEALDPRHVERCESERGTLLGWLYDPSRNARTWDVDDLDTEAAYKPWDVVHYRLRSSNSSVAGKTQAIRNIYGTSILKTARGPAREFRAGTDILMVYRLTNTLDRRNFKVDVGTTSTEMEIWKKVRLWKMAMKRQVYQSPTSGEYDVLYNPLGLTEDLIWPTSTGSASAVEIIPGTPNIYAAYDMDLTMTRLHNALRSKKEWFGYGEGATEENRAFSARSIQFARQAQRLQKYLILGLSRLFQIHLALLGKSTSASNFSVCMVPPSPLELLQRLEVLQTVLDVGDRMITFGDRAALDPIEWRNYLMDTLFGFSQEDIERFSAKVDDQQIRDAHLQQIGIEGDGGMGGGGLGGMPGEVPGGAPMEPLVGPPEGGAELPPGTPTSPEEVTPQVASTQRKRPSPVNEAGGAFAGVLRQARAAARASKKATYRMDNQGPLPLHNDMGKSVGNKLEEAIRKERDLRESREMDKSLEQELREDKPVETMDDIKEVMRRA